MLTGSVAYLSAFDIAYDLRRPPPTRLLGADLLPTRIEAGKRVPRQLLFERPLCATLPPIELRTPAGPARIERSVRVLNVGALSVTLRVPFAVGQLAELVGWHDLHLAGRDLHQEATRIAEQALAELRPHLVRPVARLEDEEAYTVFCLDPAGIAGFDGGPWLEANRRAVAALLAQEEDPQALADAEVEESTARWLSYYRSDLLVVDWDAALVVDAPHGIDDALMVLELANAELTELEAYDRLLDRAVESCYPDIGGSWVRSRSAVVRELGEISVDLARMQDELSNATKLHGDYHLARLHQAVAARFHLNDWWSTITAKLRTVDGIYQHLRQDLSGRWMMVLEIAIVVLFIIDLALIVWGKG